MPVQPSTIALAARSMDWHVSASRTDAPSIPRPLVDRLAGLGGREVEPRPLGESPRAGRALGLAGVVRRHAHALVEGHAHAGAVGLLQVERTCHLAHVQLAELPPGLLVYHRSHPRFLW